MNNPGWVLVNWGRGSPPYRRTAAALELFAAAAWAGIVTARGLHPLPALVFVQDAHDVGGRAARSQQLGHGAHVRVDVVEEELVGGTQVAQAPLTVGSGREAVFGAVAVAGEPDTTVSANGRQGPRLGGAELELIF